MGEEGGDGEQGQGNGELRHDETPAEAIAEASAGMSVGGLQGGVHVDAGSGPGGGEGEEAGGGHGDGECGCQVAPFEGEGEAPVAGGGGPGDQSPRASGGEKQRGGGSQGGEDEALGEQLAGDAGAGGAAARPSIRLARLLHAMRSTSPVMPASTQSGRPKRLSSSAMPRLADWSWTRESRSGRWAVRSDRAR